MRNVSVAREGSSLVFSLDDKPLKVRFDMKVVDAALKAKMLYPALKDKLIADLAKKLEDCPESPDSAELAVMTRRARDLLS